MKLRSKKQPLQYLLDSCSMQGRRQSQEDAFLITRGPFGDIIGLVADGVGGYAHGEFASQTVKDVFENTFAQMDQFDSVESYIRKTMYVAVTMLMQRSMGDSSYKEACTTVSGFIITRKNLLYVFNVGDSRVYRFRNSELERLTVDHSYVQELIDSGRISEDAAFDHPDKNEVTNVLCSSLTGLRIDVETVGEVMQGDLILASTDGVHDYIRDSEIQSFIAGYKGNESLAKALCELAYERRSYDNITAITCQRII